MKNFVIALALVLLSVVFTLAVFEVGLRLTSDAPAAAKAPKRIVYQVSDNPEREYKFIPGKTGWASGTETTINEHGHRGRTADLDNFHGKRILVIGDSIAFGHGLTAAESFANQLHERLNSSTQDYEVLNFGVPGYDTIQAVAYLEELVAEYQPDYVVLGFCLNDMGIVTLDIAGLLNPAPKRGIWYKSRVFRFVEPRYRRIRNRYASREKNEAAVFQAKYAGRISPIEANEAELRSLMEQAPDIYFSSWFREEDRIGRLRYALERLATLGKQSGFTTTVVIFPILTTEEIAYPHQSAHKIVAMEATRAGLDVIDMLDVMQSDGREQYKLSESDLIHPNALGHAATAKVLEQQYKQQD
jgi:lysophospholipase L1-like esterase